MPATIQVQQPVTHPSMDSEKASLHLHSTLQQEHPQECMHQHHSSHVPNWRHFVLPLVLSTISLIVVLLLSSVLAEAMGFDGVTSMLTKRASHAEDDNNGNVFIDKKYYIIVLVVGIVLVILLGICLSAWCCKGAFQNPLCCPCYLCACCGGLACLECIGCGLCIDLADQA
ncbi:hypothetical protein DL96DRAFT_1823496 [Flagelloscypha sp. PMI_526]|nr:hypothetical protein DL96DRAFT_1823496 [Flagelloscypha sp. PMI_526]